MTATSALPIASYGLRDIGSSRTTAVAAGSCSYTPHQPGGRVRFEDRQMVGQMHV